MNTSSSNKHGSSNTSDSESGNRKNPFAFLQSFLSDRLQPPEWLVKQGQQRLVLFLNHVLMQEKVAQERLMRQKGRVVQVKWGIFGMDLVITPAGLVDLAPAFNKPDLVMTMAVESPLDAFQSAVAGKRPSVSIEGDVQLAADIGWLADNLRWDVEEDLSRVIGDAPAHAIAQAGQRIAAGIRQFLTQGPLASAAASVFGSKDSASKPSSADFGKPFSHNPQGSDAQQSHRNHADDNPASNDAPAANNAAPPPKAPTA